MKRGVTYRLEIDTFKLTAILLFLQNETSKSHRNGYADFAEEKIQVLEFKII